MWFTRPVTILAMLFLSTLGSDGNGILAQLPILPPRRANTKRINDSPTNRPIMRGSDLLVTDSYLAASDAFNRVAKGHITPIIDPDGAIRKVPAAICIDGDAYPALGIAPLLQLASGSDWEASIRRENGFLSPIMTMSLGPFSSFIIPLDSNGKLRISFRKSPDAFRSISAIDIIDGNFEADILDNGVVLVGATAFGLDDIVPTPYSGFTPGVELQARVLASILDAEVPYEPAGRSTILAVICLFFGGFLYICASGRGELRSSVCDFSGHNTSISLTVHGVILTSYGLWLGWVMPGLFGFLAALSLLVTELAQVRFERGRVMQNLNNYLPNETARRALLITLISMAG